jgi:hypothetical protein
MGERYLALVKLRMTGMKPQAVDKSSRRSHGRVERLAMDGPLVSRYLTLRRISLEVLYPLLIASFIFLG